MKVYEIPKIWFKVFCLSILGGLSLFQLKTVEAYQQVPTPSGVMATIIYAENVNVRSGPSTTIYPIIGQLAPGDIVPALGISPGGEWIQISFPSGQNGIGWVYASFVSLAGGELVIVEPPATPTPLVTSTIDPTLAAQFEYQPTATRIPTFTPPPPLNVPQYSDIGPARQTSSLLGWLILVLGGLGALGLVASFILRL